ncbi:phospholipase C/P1 nuclease, partial [Meira miltonrushii]
MASGKTWITSLVVLSLIVILSCASTAHAWGVTGHQIVATIAQTQLHPDVRAHLCTILPPEQTAYRSFYPKEGAPHQHCHLAPLSAWADRVHGQYPWASHLHYINPVQDDPPKHCTYGEKGWQDHGTGNVLEAILNYTSALQTKSGYERDIALRFLTHFMGDSHQPLHLTGRARGGNDVHVRFNGRFARLHSVWDSLLLNDQIRDVANYTTRLPSTRIESALLGRTYDSYIRWIMAEGLGQAQGANVQPGWWHDEAESWTHCPEEKVTLGKDGKSNKTQELHLSSIDDTDLPVCPYAWTKPMHPLVCSYAFADPVPPVNQSNHGPLAELNVPEYAGRVHDHKIIHRQLARAGIRLAAVLNTILLP